MNVIGKECLHDCEADLSAAFGEVIAAIADGCVDCAARREGISEVMRDQRVLRTLRPVLIRHLGEIAGKVLSGAF